MWRGCDLFFLLHLGYVRRILGQISNTSKLFSAEDLGLCSLGLRLSKMWAPSFYSWCLCRLDDDLRFLSMRNIMQGFPRYEVGCDYSVALVFLSFAFEETFYILFDLLLLRKQQRSQRLLLHCCKHVDALVLVSRFWLLLPCWGLRRSLWLCLRWWV